MLIPQHKGEATLRALRELVNDMVFFAGKVRRAHRELGKLT